VSVCLNNYHNDSFVGDVEEINYLNTKLRLDDDSIIAVPNAMFIEGEVVNWSRTPYRYFQTHLLLDDIDHKRLTTIIGKPVTQLGVDCLFRIDSKS
jgi:hypothetical protein